MRSEKGIALITLVITIIVLGILAAVSLSGVIGSESIVDRARGAIFKSELRDLKDTWDTKKVSIDQSKLNFDNLEDVIDVEQIPEDLRGKLQIKNGVLSYKVGQDSNGKKIVSDKERKWMEEIGVNKPFDNVNVNIIASVGLDPEDVLKPKDVVIVLDTSTTLADASYENSSKKRYEDLVPALNKMMNNILSVNSENRVAIIQYSSTVDVVLPLDHYSLTSGTSYFNVNTSADAAGEPFATTNSYVKNSAGNVYSGISLTLETGTQNIQAGIAAAEKIYNDRNLLEGTSTAHSDAIFVFTNGEPRYASTNYKYENLSSIADSSDSSYYENTSIASYYTIKLINEIRSVHEVDMYTVNFTNSNIAKVTMNPNIENLSLVTEDSTEFEAFYKLNIADAVVSYAKGAYSGELSTSDLLNAFNDLGTKIASGEKQTDLENFTTGSTIVLYDTMTYDDPVTNNRITYKIVEDGQIEVTVKATIFDSNGNSTLRSAEEIRLYSFTDIKNGVEPNLSIDSQGAIKWDVTASFDTEDSNSIRNAVIRRLESAYVLSDGESIEVSDVTIKIPVYEVSSVPIS